MTSLTDRFSPSITNMIRMDHTSVLATFHQYEIDSSPKTKKALVNTLCLALEIHAQLEEEIFYPALRSLGRNREVVDRSPQEHDEMRSLIGRLRSMQPSDAQYDQTVMQLMRTVMHHVADEETTLLPDAEIYLSDRLGELGVQMTKRRIQIGAPRAREFAANAIKGLPTTSMLVAAGAVLAGTYLMKRSGRPHWNS